MYIYIYIYTYIYIYIYIYICMVVFIVYRATEVRRDTGLRRAQLGPRIKKQINTYE